MPEAPKTQKAIFDMASIMFLDLMRYNFDKQALDKEKLRMIAVNCIGCATMFMQTFKDQVLTPAATKPI